MMPKLGRPPISRDERQSEMVRVLLRPDVYQKVEMISEQENRSMSSIAREALEGFLEERDA